MRLAGDNATLLKRAADNAALQAAQHETNRLLTKAHDAEITQVRAYPTAAGWLRIESKFANCPSGQAVAASANCGDPADSSTQVLDPEMDLPVKALILEMEETAVTGPAAQEFILENGLAP